MRTIFVLFSLLLALPVAAQQADPPLPRGRPDVVAPAVPLPRERPEPRATGASSSGAGEVHGPLMQDAPAEPIEPRIYQVACPAVLLGQVEAMAVPPISDGQCHAQSPLAVTGVLANGRIVPVSGGVQTDCGVASALPAWVESIDSYLLARENTEIAEIVVGTSYMCRNVNGASTGNLSFHAFADALDIVGFRLADGRFVTVAEGWADASSAEGRLLRFAHDSACAHFTTVLGPEANAEHQDHLHLDLGCHGKTCTARLCE